MREESVAGNVRVPMFRCHYRIAGRYLLGSIADPLIAKR